MPELATPSIHATLAEREARYGDFTDHAAITEDLISLMMFTNNGEKSGWSELNSVQRQALRIIADKIARILNGDPNYDDNWKDIAGYATLVLERLVPKPLSDLPQRMREDMERFTGLTTPPNKDENTL